jgi:hypothetical protein
VTLFVFPDPRADVAAELTAAKAARWPTATISTSFPTSAISVPHIQHAWDGTPSQQQNRQSCTIRVTVWTPKGEVSAGIALAQLVRAVLLAGGSASVWRFTRGPGPLPGIDPDTSLPFCTFSLTAETRPTAVA